MLLYMYIDVVLLTKAVWFSVPITVPPGKGILSKKKNTMPKNAVCWIIQFDNVIASKKAKNSIQMS